MSEPSCTQGNRITKLERAVAQIGSQVSQINAKLSAIETKLEEALDRLNEHHGILYGGQGRAGMLAWKERTTETLDELKLALKGYGKEPGLIAVIADLSEKIGEISDDRKWLVRMVISYVITLILSILAITWK